MIRLVYRSRALVVLVLLFVSMEERALAADVSPAVTKALQEVEALLTQSEASGKECDAALISLTLSRAIDPKLNIPEMVAKVDAMAAEVASTHALHGGAVDNIPDALRTVIYNRHQLAFVPPRVQALVPGWISEYRWLSQLCDTGYGTCMSLSTLYFAIAQRNGYDLWPVFIPNHVFIRHCINPETYLNIETTSNGQVVPDILYHPGDFFTTGPGNKKCSMRNFTAQLVGLHLGMHYYKAEKYDDAYVCMEMAVKLEPDNPSILINRGIALRKLNRQDDAIQDYRRAIELDNGYWAGYSASAYYNMGNIYSKAGKYTEAQQCYEKCLGYNSTHIEARMGVAEMRWKQTNKWIPEAVEDFEKGNALAAKDQHSEAIAAYKRSINLMPDNYFAHTHLGNSLIALKREEEALAAFEAALVLEPKHPTAMYGKATILHRMGKSDQAIAAVLAFLGEDELDPNYVKLLYVLGAIYKDLGLPEKSNDYFEKLKKVEMQRKFLVNPGF